VGARLSTFKYTLFFVLSVNTHGNIQGVLINNVKTSFLLAMMMSPTQHNHNLPQIVDQHNLCVRNIS